MSLLTGSIHRQQSPGSGLCCLKILWWISEETAPFYICRLDQASLSDQVIAELRTLEAKNPKLLISSTW